MIPKNQIAFTILEDGTVKIETGNLQGPLHSAADRFLIDIQQLLGGEVIEEKSKQGHHHHHDHDHADHHHDLEA